MFYLQFFVCFNLIDVQIDFNVYFFCTSIKYKENKETRDNNAFGN